MDEVFEQAKRHRRRHEFTLTSRDTNAVYYGSPAWAKKKDIWPPLSSELKSENSAPSDLEVSREQFLQRLHALETPLESPAPSSRVASVTSEVNAEHLYEPLHEGYLIRLIEVLPGKYDDLLKFKFHYADLTEDHIIYEALSYVWGQNPLIKIGTDYQDYKCNVQVNGHKLPIPANLERALRSLRFDYASRLLWVDSICINQADVQERGHQVSLMSAVYKHAWRVIVWLGDIPRWSLEESLIDYDNIKAEHGFGAICDVVNDWLNGGKSGRKASYRIISNSHQSDNGTERQFSKFQMESFTVQTSKAIEKKFSTPDQYGFLRAPDGLSKGLGTYLRRKYGTYEPKIDYKFNGESYEADDLSEDPGLQADERTAKKSAFWQAIDNLFSCTWFWRLWVFQEIVLARTAVVKLGHCEINWHWIGLAAAILRTNYHGVCESLKMGGIYNAYLMFRMSGLSDLPPLKLDFLRLLRLTRQFEVTDSRDRIYGLLGITTAENDPENGKFFLKPDYTIDNGELWRMIAIKIMIQKHDLTLLSSVQYTTEKLESEHTASRRNFYLALDEERTKDAIPSWVPQWNYVFRATLSPWDSDEKFSTSRHLPTADTKIGSESLLVQGLEVGMIVHTLSFMWHDIDLSLLWSRHLQEIFNTEAGLHLLAHTLTAGRDAYGSIIQDNGTAVADLAAYIISLEDYSEDKDLLGRHDEGSYMSRHARDKKNKDAKGPNSDLLRRLAVDGSAARFRETAIPYCERRRLFLTLNGFVGLGPDTLMEGDVLCVLAGGDLPFILRPKKQEDEKGKRERDGCVNASGHLKVIIDPDYYLLVGESYVKGLMKGEAVGSVNSKEKLIGPVNPTLVVKEVLEKAGLPVPEMGFVSDKLDCDKNRRLHEVIAAGQKEFERIKLRRAEVKWFDIR